MDRLDAMALFVAAVDAGSLAGAARRHGRSAATVTRAVAQLERHVGETLLLRSTRSLGLTAAGARHVEAWREVLARLAESEGGGAAQGTIVLTAPELFGRLHVLPPVETFLDRHPRAAARLLLENRVVDLVGEGVDLAVRLAPLTDSTLTAVRLGTVATLVCAAPAYLARAGTPADPDDLAGHDCIGLNAAGEGELWPFARPGATGGRMRAVRVRPRMAISNAAAGLDAALRGRGVIRARAYQVAADLAAGRLVRLLPGHEPPASPAHLLFQADRARRGVVRAFIDHAVPALRRDLRQIEAALPPAG